MDGVLVIDKPAGPTSHDVVAVVRRALGTPRIGHTGTLDPLATGVLPLVVGRATKLASLLSASEKSYEAAVRLGGATDTFDAAGRQAASPPPPPEKVGPAEVERALGEFRGTYFQAPPAYSAKKIAGVPAYRLARRQTPAQPAPVNVTVAELELIDYADGLVRFSVTASAGFYVRSLAHDLGQRLGCGGYLEALRRTRAGGFVLADAVALEAILSEGRGAAHRLLPLEALLPDVPAVVLTSEGARRASHGSQITAGDITRQTGGVGGTAAMDVRLLDPAGRLLAIARPGLDGALRPAIVLV